MPSKSICRVIGEQIVRFAQWIEGSSPQSDGRTRESRVGGIKLQSFRILRYANLTAQLVYVGLGRVIRNFSAAVAAIAALGFAGVANATVYEFALTVSDP